MSRYKCEHCGKTSSLPIIDRCPFKGCGKTPPEKRVAVEYSTLPLDEWNEMTPAQKKQARAMGIVPLMEGYATIFAPSHPDSCSYE